jgi:uncharacterized protein
MPGPPTNQRLPRWVDARKFAHQHVELAGHVPQDTLPRLQLAVASIESPVYVQLRFAIDPSRIRTVTGPLQVRVKMVCQRCMGETDVELASELAVGVVASDEESKQLPRSLEPWVVSREASEADLYAVIEDELLLDLPMVVYHDYQCLDEQLYSAGDATTAAAQEEGKRNPFQILEQLKGGKKK